MTGRAMAVRHLSPGRTVADCAEDVRAIAAAFGIDRLAVWGISGGGPHALACAALLPDLVSAVGSLASLAPYGAPGLDYFAGMGQDNADDIRLFLSDPDGGTREVQGSTVKACCRPRPKACSGSWRHCSRPTDAEALTPEFAAFLVNSSKVGLATSDQGWWDDACAHLGPWGFDVEDIRIPVQLWHGAQDQFVPFQHGQWLAAHIPGVDAHLTETDGHVTLGARRIPEVHEWLLRQP